MSEQETAGFLDTGLFRSVEMKYLKFLIPKDACHRALHTLGKLDTLHLVDTKMDGGLFQNECKRRVISASALHNRLENLEAKIREFEIPLEPFDSDFVVSTPASDSVDSLHDAQTWLDNFETRLSFHSGFIKENSRRANTYREEREVLRLVSQVHSGSSNQLAFAARSDPVPDDEKLAEEKAYDSDEEDSSLLLRDMENGRERSRPNVASTVLREIAGVVPESRCELLDRMIWRASRGKAVVRPASQATDFLDRDSNLVTRKVAFSVLFLGAHLENKISRLIESFSGTVYDVSQVQNLSARLNLIESEIASQIKLSIATREEIRSLLQEVTINDGANLPPIRHWQILICKEMSIAEAVKSTRLVGDFVHLEAWCPDRQVDLVSKSFLESMEAIGLRASCQLEDVDIELVSPPTYFKVNCFTAPFQTMVDTYGVPRYREINPALFTIITFPFLFGVMYGDIGHSSFLVLATLYLILNESNFTKAQRTGQLGEMTESLFTGRYLLLLMGLFAHYAGWIYNDMFSLSINAFGSAYQYSPNGAVVRASTVYPFGVDPVWSSSAEDLTFYNSLKMKLSIIIGVTHMTFGVILSLFNKLYFRDFAGVFLEFIPQLIFMLSLFGYMVLLIILKWCTDFSVAGSRQPPNLIQTMMGLLLKPGVVEADLQLYPGQSAVQSVLLYLALLSVPVMLFGKPIWKIVLFHGSTGEHQEAVVPVDLQFSEKLDEDEEKDDIQSHSTSSSKFDEFGELMIHQGIHTIEYVLGTVSNTASYLRLWALSLAHSELSKVFWNQLFMLGLKSSNPLVIFICWGAWAAITLGVLLLMDVLECFLHALRLHWVEFQNKFFEASGYLYVPYSLKWGQKSL